MVALSAAGAAFIAKFEGTRLALYNDPGNNCTIGIGHLVHTGPCNGSEPVEFKQGITEQQALDLLTSDAKLAADCVTSHVKVALSQGQTDALISFVYNIGCGAFQTSDLLTLLNQGDYTSVPVQLMRWTHGGGVELPGLVIRRRAEGLLFAASGGGAMTSLPNFPMVSQLTQITSDGRPSENAVYDCVPASIGAAILWYEGKHQWDASINPDLLKDKAYGEGWQNNGTSASAYVATVAQMGYKLFHIDGNGAALVQHAHTELANQHPVVFTEPDPYVPASYGWSHVCVFYASSPGKLTCLDPYIGKPVTRSDAEWAQMLMFNQIWIVEKDMIIDLNNAEVAAHFTASGNGWLCKTPAQDGKQKNIHGAILDHYKTCGYAPLCGFSAVGLPESNEIAIESIGASAGFPFKKFAGHGIVVQFFERGSWIYDPGHLVDNPTGSGSVYPLHLYTNSPGTDPRVFDLRGQVADLQKQLAANPGNVALQQELDAANGKLAQFKALALAM